MVCTLGLNIVNQCVSDIIQLWSDTLYIISNSIQHWYNIKQWSYTLYSIETLYSSGFIHSIYNLQHYTTPRQYPAVQLYIIQHWDIIQQWYYTLYIYIYIYNMQHYTTLRQYPAVQLYIIQYCTLHMIHHYPTPQNPVHSVMLLRSIQHYVTWHRTR